MDEENVFKKYGIIAAIIILAVAAAIYFYYFKKEPPKPPQEKAAQNLEEVSAAVPEITTNPVEEKTPELNPVERANPFKYQNPLR